MRAILAIAAALLLSACGKTVPVVDTTPPPPVPIKCLDIVKDRCQTQPPLWQPPDASSPEAWKLLLPQVSAPMAREIRDCDAKVAEFHRCLDEAQDKGLIRWR
jgi:hypothetical protein